MTQERPSPVQDLRTPQVPRQACNLTCIRSIESYYVLQHLNDHFFFVLIFCSLDSGLLGVAEEMTVRLFH